MYRSYLAVFTGVVGSAPVPDASDIYGENLNTRNIVTDSMSSAMQHNAHYLIRW